MILVDSSVWIGYFNGLETWQVNLLDELLSDVQILMGDLIFTEVLKGFRSDKDFQTVKKYLSCLPFREMVGYDVALKSALNYRTLQKKGVTVRKTIDVIIGTFCIMQDIVLLHDDRDFDSLETHLSLKVLSA